MLYSGSLLVYLFYNVLLCSVTSGVPDCSPLGSSVHGISQAAILEWVAISFYRESFEPLTPAKFFTH